MRQKQPRARPSRIWRNLAGKWCALPEKMKYSLPHPKKIICPTSIMEKRIQLRRWQFKSPADRVILYILYQMPGFLSITIKIKIKLIKGLTKPFHSFSFTQHFPCRHHASQRSGAVFRAQAKTSGFDRRFLGLEDVRMFRNWLKNRFANR